MWAGKWAGPRVLRSHNQLFWTFYILIRGSAGGSNKQRGDLQRRKKNRKEESRGQKSCRCYDLRSSVSYFYTKPFFYEESLLFFYYGVLSTSLEDYLKLCFKNCPFYCVSHLVYNLNNIAKAGKLFFTIIFNRILFIVLFALELQCIPHPQIYTSKY